MLPCVSVTQFPEPLRLCSLIPRAFAPLLLCTSAPLHISAKVQPVDLPATFQANSFRQGPASGPSGNFPGRFFPPRSSRWTFEKLFRADSFRQGPASGPSSNFPGQFFPSSSSQWTFGKLFRPILSAKVQPMDLRETFRPLIRRGMADNHLAISNLLIFLVAKKETKKTHSQLQIKHLPITIQWRAGGGEDNGAQKKAAEAAFFVAPAGFEPATHGL